jgi:two-component system, NtrC family, sensor kinase
LAESMERAKREREKAEQAVRQSERLAAIGQMAAGIGHEINNPLMNIMSLASLVEQSVPANEHQTRDDLRALQNEGRRCARIVNGILNFARENAPRFERFDMARLIDDTSMLFKHRMDSAGLTLETDVQRPLFVEGDSGQLQQVLVNLLLNAVQASPPDSVIRICARAVDDMLSLEVVDSGCGLTEETQSKLFNPFFTTKPEGTGTGLGLSVSYGIIKKHGGTISLENRSEGGVRVQVNLPVCSVLAQPGPKEQSEVRNVG